MNDVESILLSFSLWPGQRLNFQQQMLLKMVQKISWYTGHSKHIWTKAPNFIDSADNMQLCGIKWHSYHFLALLPLYLQHKKFCCMKCWSKRQTGVVTSADDWWTSNPKWRTKYQGCFEAKSYIYHHICLPLMAWFDTDNLRVTCICITGQMTKKTAFCNSKTAVSFQLSFQETTLLERKKVSIFTNRKQEGRNSFIKQQRCRK